jgi:hypothetical protein
MADNQQTPHQSIPPLPQPPKQDVWGRDLPNPNPQTTAQPNAEQAIEDNTEAVKHLTDENKEIFGDIMEQFEDYVSTIKKANQNFFLKQGKLLATEFRKSVLEGMVEGAEKSGEIGKLEDVNHNLRVVWNNLDKMIAIQSEQTTIAKQNQEEDKKEKVKRKVADANTKEDKKESMFGGLSQFILGKTGAQRRADDKEKRDNKRTGGLFGGDGLFSMITDFLFKVVPLVGLAVGLLGPDGVANLVKVFTPAIMQLSDIVYSKVIEPSIKMAGQMVKDMVIDPALKRLDIASDVLPYSDPKAKPGDLNSPYEKDGTFNPLDPKHSINVIKSIAKYLMDLDMKKTTAQSAVAHPVAPPTIMNSEEYAEYLKKQAAPPEHDRNGPLAKPKVPIENAHKNDIVIAPQEHRNIGKERDDFVAPMPDNDSSTKNIDKLDAETDALIKKQKNAPSIEPISPQDIQKRTDSTFDKINGDMATTWAAGVNNFFTGLSSVFTGEGGLMTPIGKIVDQNKPKNDFDNMLASMDRFSKVTDTMKAQSKADATKTVTPIIVQAPTSINTSSTVSNGTTVNSPARTNNDRSLLGYR